MVDKIGNPQHYEPFLPCFRTLLRDHGILLVLDNLDTLLTDDGAWRDPPLESPGRHGHRARRADPRRPHQPHPPGRARRTHW
jgi:hypothetical protein